MNKIFFSPALAILLFSGFTKAAEQAVTLAPSLADFLYASYSDHKDDFIPFLQANNISLQESKNALVEAQAILKASLDSLSYKNVFFSRQGIGKMGLLFVGLTGLGINNLQAYIEHYYKYSVALGTTLTLKKHNPVSFLGDYPSDETIASAFWHDKTLQSVPVSEVLPAINATKDIFGNDDFLPQSNSFKLSQYFSENPGYFTLLKGTTAVMAAAGGFGLISDIRNMQQKKKQLTERYNTGEEMLALLQEQEK